jgi:RNA polymerase sigma-70 factor (ECF subfamily)
VEPTPIRETFATDRALADIWLEHHRYLLNVAYRMLGSVSEAEDVVQDAFARLLRVDIGEIMDIRGWLVVAVTRRCLDELRSARSRREVYTGPWLPEPVIDPPDHGSDPADKVTLDDSVRMAMLLVLERLSPNERAAFILHDVFQFSFEEVAEIVGKSPSACRQLASRARRHIHEDASPARFTASPDEAAHIADRFIAAATRGDLNALMQVLDPNVAGHADSGGIFPAARGPQVGRERVAPIFTHFVTLLGLTLQRATVNGEPGVLAFQGDRLLAIASLEMRNGLITHVHIMANPYKLAYAASLLNVETVHERDFASLLAAAPGSGRGGPDRANTPPNTGDGDDADRNEAFGNGGIPDISGEELA